ncbi:MAG: amidase family protein, partial [Halieaceae bacterium]
IILAKTTLTELANWVGTGMPGNYNTLRGYGYNPYDPRPDPRPGLNDGRGILDTGGSSSGIGTAANFWAANIGTETSGSILSPANSTMLAAIKPTVGRISRYGIIPITADQDTAGPLAKSVADAAALLEAMEGKDKNDNATGVCPPLRESNYQTGLKRDALQGARIGIPRDYFYEALETPFSDTPIGGLNDARAQAMEKAIALLRAEGAIVVDPVQIPSIAATTAEDSALQFGICYDAERGKPNDEGCSVILKYGMKRDFNAWLASLGDSAPVVTLTELREFNTARQAAGAIRYGQAQLDISDEMDVVADAERYQADRAKDIRLSRAQGIDAALTSHKLDALLMPSWFGEEMLNKAGYPAVMVPFTTIASDHTPALPADFKPVPSRFGVAFYGSACSEGRLIALAYGFEQATKARVAPPQFP